MRERSGRRSHLKDGGFFLSANLHAMERALARAPNYDAKAKPEKLYPVQPKAAVPTSLSMPANMKLKL